MNSIHKVLLLVTLCLTVFFTFVKSHSYVECADWRFNNPNVPGWAEGQGTCHGYARKWPKGQYPNVKFGMFDDIWPGYKDQGQVTYGAAKNPDTQPACHPDFQARTNPITNSYAPANSNYGAMVQATSGQQLCWTWSGRNHADGGETCVDRSGILCPVYINMATTANNDPTQAQFSMQNIAKITFSNCTRNDNRYDNANRPCGGCFTLPQRTPGTYAMQWRWALNHDSSGFDEVYTTCTDVVITGDSQTPTSNNPTPTSQAPQTTRATSQAQQTTRATSQAQQTTRATSQAQQTTRATSQAQTSRAQTSQGTSSQRTRTSSSANTQQMTSESDSSNEVSQTQKPSPPPSDTNTLYDFADAYVRGGNTGDDNFGLDPTLRIKYAADPTFARESYLSFDFFDVPTPVGTCTLVLNQLLENGLDFAFDFKTGVQIGSTWNEDTITYNNKPTITGVVSVNKELGQNQLNVDITGYCNQAIQAQEIVTLRLYKTGGSDVDQLVLHSKESTSTDLIPKILMVPVSNTDASSTESSAPEGDSATSLLTVFNMILAVSAFILMM